MRGYGSGGTHGGAKRRRRHSSGKPWRKYSGKKGGGDGVRGTRSRFQGDTSGAGERGFRDAGTETGNTHLVELSRAEDGDAGTETGDTQVGRVSRTGAGAGMMTGL